MRKALRFLGLAAALVSPLAAQQPDDGSRGPMGGPEGGMMRHSRSGMMRHGGWSDGYSPERLLSRNGELQLTAQQITALTALRDATRKAAQAAMEQARKHMDELRVALDASTADTAAIRAHFLGAHDAMGQARLARLIANAKAKTLLTDAQRAEVAKWRGHKGRGGWGGGRRGADWGRHGAGGPGGPGGPPTSPST